MTRSRARSTSASAGEARPLLVFDGSEFHGDSLPGVEGFKPDVVERYRSDSERRADDTVIADHPDLEREDLLAALEFAALAARVLAQSYTIAMMKKFSNR